MANVIECDRCHKQERNDSLPDKWKEICINDNISSTIGGSTRQICESCVESFWKWFQNPGKQIV